VLGLVLGATLPASAGNITYACAANITSTTDGPALCNYLNTTIAGLYGSTFTNANANIYIQFGNAGLGENIQAINLVTYSEYFAALSSESTDYTAVQSLAVGASSLGSEPTIYNGANVGLTSALASALGFSGVQGLTAPTVAGTNTGVVNCSIGTSGCYNGVITIDSSEPLWYRSLSGDSQPGGDYDFFSIVEHESDEILGTISCIATTDGLFDQCGGPGSTVPSANDLFRYSAAGQRDFDDTAAAYFSLNGGVTDTDGNQYNHAANGEDYADFSSNCKFVQDATGCQGGSLNITTDGPGGTPGPEVAMLNAVGYDLTTPEPASLLLFTSGLLGLAARARRKRSIR
jgi:hypothetical protein